MSVKPDIILSNSASDVDFEDVGVGTSPRLFPSKNPFSNVSKFDNGFVDSDFFFVFVAEFAVIDGGGGA
jgi:hypothetical protein